MGKQSTRENKTIYQICREEAGLTRSEASEKMTAVSDSKMMLTSARISAIIIVLISVKSDIVMSRKSKFLTYPI